MMRHEGRIVEDIIRKKQINLSELAIQLSVNRSNLYTWFKSEYLKAEIVLQIGKNIRYDFSEDFPDLKKYTGYQSNRKKKPSLDEDIDYKAKYVELLEKFRSLLENRSMISSDNSLAIE